MSSVKAFKLAVAVAALAATGSAAQAQSKAALWEGAYVGVHAGGEFGKFNFSRSSGFDQLNDQKGIIGGVHGGYNWQAGSLVYGIELDADLSSSKKSVSGTAGGFTAKAEISNSFLGSLRGRIGYADGAALFFATGGLAYGSGKFEGSVTGPGVNVKGSVEDTRAGYVIGLGAEYAFTSAMSLRVEGLHYGFKDVFKNDLGAGGKFDANVIRAGLSYKF
jgi:outer membrane immunogenic protein